MAKDSVAVAKPAKKSDAKSKPAKLPSPLHPPYLQMIKEAISALKDRTGSSQQAISKFIEEKYKTGLTPNFKKILSVQLKKFAKSEKLVKVKNSFKIAAAEKVKKVDSDAKVSKTATKRPASEGKVAKAVTKKAAVGEKRKRVVGATAGAKGKVVVKKKRLSQVVTPKQMKKKPATPKKVVKSIKKTPKPVVKRVKKA